MTEALHSTLRDILDRVRKARLAGLGQRTWPTLRVLCATCAVRAAVGAAFDRFHAESGVRVLASRCCKCHDLLRRVDRVTVSSHVPCC